MIHVYSCACDIPSHNYTYSFEPKDFSRVYAGSHEIKQYFESFAEIYGLHKYVKLHHKVRHAQWMEVDGLWEIEAINMMIKLYVTRPAILLSTLQATSTSGHGLAFLA